MDQLASNVEKGAPLGKVAPYKYMGAIREAMERLVTIYENPMEVGIGDSGCKLCYAAELEAGPQCSPCPWTRETGGTCTDAVINFLYKHGIDPAGTTPGQVLYELRMNKHPLASEWRKMRLGQLKKWLSLSG